MTMNPAFNSTYIRTVTKKCVLCGATDNLELHHIKPKSMGGSDAPENLVLLCSTHHKLLHSSGQVKKASAYIPYDLWVAYKEYELEQAKKGIKTTLNGLICELLMDRLFTQKED